MTLRFAVIGNPVAHSKSPVIHAAFAKSLGMAIQYERLLAPVDGFTDAVDRFREEGGAGANVTLPFKQDAYRYATELSAAARQAQAVNTLSFRFGAVSGDNTDGIGLARDIEHNCGYALAGKRVLIVGAGGAARGVVGPLLATQPAFLAIANRTQAKAEDIAALFAASGKVSALPVEALTGHAFDVVINATSASLGDALPPVPRNVFASGALAYDMVYGKGSTPFLDLARQCGARPADGLGMLVEQAAEAFRIWHGVRPETAAVLSSLRAELRAA
jgi:shikimate dehydrogenase